MTWTPTEFIADYIRRWEGGLSLDKADTGNWVAGVLIGSKYGVTASALARYRGAAAADITPAIMAALTFEEAVAIGKALYYDAPGFAKLPWNRITMSIVDFGWGAGPVQAIKLLQRMIGADDDGIIGPKTIAAYRDWLEADEAMTWAAQRNAFYRLLVKQRPANAKYLNGWENRTAYFTPASEWWGRA
jgi:lysozyme family protein